MESCDQYNTSHVRLLLGRVMFTLLMALIVTHTTEEIVIQDSLAHTDSRAYKKEIVTHTKKR